MEVVNEVLPSRKETFEFLMQEGPEGPIYMVNLLKFKASAEYEDGRQTDLSGREAYNIYAEAVSKIILNYGGKVLFAADVTGLSLGQVEDLWDEVAIAQYPNRRAMVEMSSSAEWREAAVHRTAGLVGQLNIETTGLGLI